MKIRQKIIAGFLSISLLIPLLGYFSVQFQKQLIENFHHIASELLPGTIAMVKIEALLYQTLQATVSYGQSNSQSNRQEVEESLANLADYQSLHTLYHSTLMLENHKINAILQKFSRQISQYILARKNNRSSQHLFELQQGIDKTVTSYEELVDSDKDIREAAQAVASSQEHHNRMLNVVIYTGISLFIIALLSSFFLARLISHPLMVLNRATLAIARGDLDIRVDHTGSGEIAELAGSFNKMTDSLRYSNEQLEEELVKKEEAREEAEAATKVKGEIIANMSHELRTPLNAIIGFSDLSLDGKLDSGQLAYQQKINQSARSLLKIIQGVLDFSQITDGKMVIIEKEFYLPGMLNKLLQLFYDKAEKKGLKLRVQASDGNVPLYLQGNAKGLEQVLFNLLDNSLKFTKHGAVSLSIALHDRDKERCYLKFTISDSGIGIPSGIVGHIYEPLFQGDGSSTREYGGIGMGLTIAKELVELMQGTLEVSSIPGEGSHFSFLLPFLLTASQENFASLPDRYFTDMSPANPSSQITSVESNSPAVGKDEGLHSLQVQKELTELLRLLAKENFQALEKWQKFKPWLERIDCEHIEKIDQAINSFNFTTAQDLLTEIKI